MQGVKRREMKIEGQESRCRGSDKTDAKGRRGRMEIEGQESGRGKTDAKRRRGRMKIEGQESRCRGGARQMQKGEEGG
jgi:hypothetical protein